MWSENTAISWFLAMVDRVTDVVFITMWLMTPFICMRIISNFLMARYHTKIEEFLFYCYITEALSGRPRIEMKRSVKWKKASAWYMTTRLNNGVSLKIRTESEARIAAKKLFQNVAKPGSEFIDLEDLARFFPENDVVATLSIFEETSEGETTHISCSSLQHWMVYAFRLERSLVLTMEDMDSIISVISSRLRPVFGIALAIGLVPLLLGGCGYVCFFASFICLTLLSSFTSSLVRESIHYLFFCQRLDVGERCQINGVELVVKKIDFLSTTFVRLDEEECQCSNSTLLRKLISRFEGSSRLEKIELIQR